MGLVRPGRIGSIGQPGNSYAGGICLDPPTPTRSISRRLTGACRHQGDRLPAREVVNSPDGRRRPTSPATPARSIAGRGRPRLSPTRSSTGMHPPTRPIPGTRPTCGPTRAARHLRDQDDDARVGAGERPGRDAAYFPADRDVDGQRGDDRRPDRGPQRHGGRVGDRLGERHVRQPAFRVRPGDPHQLHHVRRIRLGLGGGRQWSMVGLPVQEHGLDDLHDGALQPGIEQLEQRLHVSRAQRQRDGEQRLDGLAGSCQRQSGRDQYDRRRERRQLARRGILASDGFEQSILGWSGPGQRLVVNSRCMDARPRDHRLPASHERHQRMQLGRHDRRPHIRHRGADRPRRHGRPHVGGLPRPDRRPVRRHAQTWCRPGTPARSAARTPGARPGSWDARSTFTSAGPTDPTPNRTGRIDRWHRTCRPSPCAP